MESSHQDHNVVFWKNSLLDELWIHITGTSKCLALGKQMLGIWPIHKTSGDCYLGENGDVAWFYVLIFFILLYNISFIFALCISVF